MDWLQFTHIWYYSLTKFRAKFWRFSSQDMMEACTWYLCYEFYLYYVFNCYNIFFNSIRTIQAKKRNIKSRPVTDICVKLCFWRPLFGVPYSFFSPQPERSKFQRDLLLLLHTWNIWICNYLFTDKCAHMKSQDQLSPFKSNCLQFEVASLWSWIFKSNLGEEWDIW